MARKTGDAEIDAMNACREQLEPLPDEVRDRVMQWLVTRYIEGTLTVGQLAKTEPRGVDTPAHE